MSFVETVKNKLAGFVGVDDLEIKVDAAITRLNENGNVDADQETKIAQLQIGLAQVQEALLLVVDTINGNKGEAVAEDTVAGE